MIERRIADVRERAVLLDMDLARLHGLPLRALRELVHSHPDLFPGEMYFQPEPADLPDALRCSHPNVFTEQGVWMTAAVLGSMDARRRTISISRAFDRHRRKSMAHP